MNAGPGGLFVDVIAAALATAVGSLFAILYVNGAPLRTKLQTHISLKYLGNFSRLAVLRLFNSSTKTVETLSEVSVENASGGIERIGVETGAHSIILTSSQLSHHMRKAPPLLR